MPRTHNEHPELLLNHTWKIEISRDLDGNEATKDSQLLPKDRIKIVREGESNHVQLIIWAHKKGLIYVLDGMLKEIEHITIEDIVICSRAKIEFEDTVGNLSQWRSLTLTAAKMKAKYNYSADQCRSHIDAMPDRFLSGGDVQKSCLHDNLMIWRVDNLETSENLSNLNKPEPGQGTGSGGSD